jgi:hypothetical protein
MNLKKKKEVTLTDICPPSLTDTMDAGIRNGGFFVKVFTCERREGFVYPPINLVHAQVLHGEHGTSTPTADESSETLCGLQDELKKLTIFDQPHGMIRSSCRELVSCRDYRRYPSSPVPSLAIEPPCPLLTCISTPTK